MKFFLNGDNKSYLRGLESEFGESSNAIRVELNRFEDAGLLVAKVDGNKKIYQANKQHSVYKDIYNLLIKFVGIDEIIEKVLCRIGDLHSAYVIGDFARGIDNKIIDLLLVGNELDKMYVYSLLEKVERLIGRKVRVLIVSAEEAESFTKNNPHLLIWHCDTNETAVKL
ncbi:ArsR family transcriptional regulator [Mucilaginibacter terrae]|nr:ArsR family transcriptional regulator [Mucilaginibacter terrae]